MCVIGNSYFSSCSCTSAGISLLVSTLMFSNFAARFTAAHPSSSNTPVSTRSTNETSGSRRSGIPSVESNPLKMKFLFNFSCVHVNSFNHSVCLTIWFFCFSFCLFLKVCPYHFLWTYSWRNDGFFSASTFDKQRWRYDTTALQWPSSLKMTNLVSIREERGKVNGGRFGMVGRGWGKIKREKKGREWCMF